MPFDVRCPDHPDAGNLAYPTDMLLHAGSHHPGRTVQAVSDRCIMRFTSQAEARGVTSSRRFACRVCADLVDTTDPDRPPYCDDHLPVQVTT